jgi:uncharacterized Zn-finger protein
MKRKANEFVMESRKRLWLQCNTCDIVFVTFQDLIAHKRTHEEEILLELEEQIRIRDKKRPYSCMFCSSVFTTTRNRSRHEKAHVNKIHVCVVCKRTFARSDVLRKHQSTHDEQ